MTDLPYEIVHRKRGVQAAKGMYRMCVLLPINPVPPEFLISQFILLFSLNMPKK